MRALVLAVVLVFLVAALETRADCDDSQPRLTGFDIAPLVVDVSAHDAKVRCTMPVQKAGALGVDVAYCSLYSPSGQLGAGAVGECYAYKPVTGDAWDGVFQCDITIPAGSEPGDWLVWVVELYDANGGSDMHGYWDLPDMGAPTIVSVLDTSPVVTAPGIVDFDLSSTSVDVTEGDVRVTCSVAFESPAPLWFGTCQVGISWCDLVETAHGHASCDVLVPQGAPAGVQSIYVSIQNTLWAYASMDSATLEEHGWPSSVEVADAAPDVTVPFLTSLTIEPAVVDPAGDPTLAAATFAASGVERFGFGTCEFDSATMFFWKEVSEIGPGLYRCQIPITIGTTGGTWTLARVEITDHAGNSSTWYNTDLVALGFPSTFTVGCSAIPEPALRFADVSTLAWHAFAPADRFTVYRGYIAGLAFGDLGTCQSDRDPAPADTSFADTDLPAPGQSFTYLVGVRIGAGPDTLLGYASDGSARVALNACP